MNVWQRLEQRLEEVLKTPGFSFSLQNGPHEYSKLIQLSHMEGADAQWNGAFTVRFSDMPSSPNNTPRQVAEKVASLLPDLKATVSGPGFVNLVFPDQWLMDVGNEPFRQQAKKEKVLIDYGGPNVAKPLHVGHMRSAIIGNALVRLQRSLGYEVDGDVHLGDWGTQMGQVLEAIRDRFPHLPFFMGEGPYPEVSPVTLADLAEIYPAASLKSKEDEAFRARALQTTLELQQGNPGYRALWKLIWDLSVGDAKEQYDWLGIHFEFWNGESTYNDLIPEVVADLKSREIAVESRGAWIVPMEGDDPPLILLKTDGAYLYSTTDVATVVDRVRSGYDRIYIVADKRQSLHINQVIEACRRAGYLKEQQMTFYGYGTLNGADGKPFKSRDGGVMSLRALCNEVSEAVSRRMDESGIATEVPAEERAEIVQKVAVAVLKFADLSADPMSDYRFDLSTLTSFQGRTGASLIYSIVRFRSLLRKSEEGQVIFGNLHPAERALRIQISRAPEVVWAAATFKWPHNLVSYLADTAQVMNRFYEQCRVLQAPDAGTAARWRDLVVRTEKRMVELCDLVGIAVPERM